MEKKEIRLKEKTKDEEEILEEQSIKTTRALIQTFLQTMKAFRLYESNHPILVKFLDRLKKDFDYYFKEFGSFPLVVGEHRLFYRGKVVYESQDVKESLAFFFFKDGIREIKFIRGLEFKEVVDFLHIVRKSESVSRLEDDLVTLLWEKDFSHITFVTVDEFLEGESAFVPATEEEFIQRLEFREYEEGIPEEITPEKEEPSALMVEGLRQALNPSPGQSLVEACMLTPDEMDVIVREMEQEHQPDYIYTLVDNLVEILLHLGEDLDAYENMISYFEKTVGSYLEQNEVRKAVIVLTKLNSTIESMVLKDKQIFAIRRILDTFSGSHFIQRLGEAMNRNGEADPEAILQYLRLLTKKAVEPLCILLGGLESGKWRKGVCDTLVDLSQQDIQPLIKFLSDSNPFVVCHILYVLGKIGHPSALKYMGHLVIHKDQKVREETLQVIKRFGEIGRDLIQKFLKDPIPEMRAKASQIFAKLAGEDAVEALTEIILSEDFIKRGYEEKASFFKALGETGSQKAIPFLKKIEQKRKWFQRTRWNEMRLCARNTLKMVGSEKELVLSRGKHRPGPMEQSIHG